MFKSDDARVARLLDLAEQGNRLAEVGLEKVSSRMLMKCSDATLKRFTAHFEAQAAEIREATRLMLAH